MPEQSVRAQERNGSVPPLEVVVVTYRSSDLIDDCLSSAEKYTPAGTLIHVVDNASPDSTVEIVRTHHPSVLLTARRDNSGFAVANNSVLGRVTAPYVLVLNPDTELFPGVVDHLISIMDENATVGLVGCRLVTNDGTLDHAAKRFIPNPFEAIQYFTGRLTGRGSSRYTAPEVDEFGTAEVDAVNGAFMLVRKSAMDQVGLFDEAFWMYAEDLDWCTRFRKAGWTVMYDGSVTVRHVKGASSGTRSLKLNYEFHRSMAIYQRKHAEYGIAMRALVELGIWVKFGGTVLADTIRRAVSAPKP